VLLEGSSEEESAGLSWEKDRGEGDAAMGSREESTQLSWELQSRADRAASRQLPHTQWPARELAAFLPIPDCIPIRVFIFSRYLKENVKCKV
jgi:hypothetical protein